MSFDIVICIGPNDYDIIQQSIKYTKKNIIGYNKIYLIASNTQLYIDDKDNIVIINENIFPFTIHTLNNIIGHRKRNGWYLQQLLKLYASHYIPKLLDTYLVIDADTFFLKKTTFIDENNKYYFTLGYEYHKPYFNHMNKLHNTLYKYHSKSGIAHHMIFNKYYINKLFNLVEQKHNIPFWNVFLKCIENEHLNKSGASEYEIYFTFMNIYYPEKIHLRELNWKNCSHIITDNNLDYISIHWYNRQL